MSIFKTEQEIAAGGWKQRGDGTWFKPSKKSGYDPFGAPDAYREGTVKESLSVPTVAKSARVRKRIYASELDRLNKTERRCYDMLRARYNHDTVRVMIHAYTLRLGNDLRYVPDLAIVHLEGGRVDFVEIKGPHIWDRALHKPKMAANLYQHHTFWIFQWKEGAWTEVRLQP